MNDFESQPDAPQQPKRQHIARPWINFLAIILAIIAVVVAFYSYEQYRSFKQNSDSINTNNASQIQLLQSNITQLQTTLTATQQNVTQLMQRIGNSQQQTTLSQISYLINLANLQLNISHNTKSSLHMLSLAQAKIEDLNDPRLFALNKVLTKDIAELKAVPEFNMTKIISEIDMLSDEVGSSTLLPNQKDLNKAEKQSEKDVAKADPNKTDKWYERAWDHLSGIKDLIIIRKSDPNIKPLLDTEQRALVKSTIQSKLLLAEYAAIAHNNTLYQTHLATAEKWIKQYFFDSVDRESLLTHLKILQSNDVSPKIPDINDTITVLNQTLSALTDSTSSNIKPQPTLTPQKTMPSSKPINSERKSDAGVAI